jgi:hypothetical protein
MNTSCDVEPGLTMVLALSELSPLELRKWFDRAPLADREDLARALYPELAPSDLRALGRLLAPEAVR